MIDTPDLQVRYKGSVKNVFASKKDPDTLWFSFTDQYSVFDWGKMPDLIANKGNALALIGTFIFEKLRDRNFWQQLPQSSHLKKFDPTYLHKRFAHEIFQGKKGLQKNGLSSHFLGLYKGIAKAEKWQQLEPLLISEQTNNSLNYLEHITATDKLLMHVKAAQVDWPEAKSILHENIYFYPPPSKGHKRRLIPLEVVFRFGIVEGSSLIRKLEDNPSYASSLGLKSLPKINEWLPQPVLEFFTKLEPKDRPLSWQEAATIANLSPAQFEQLIELSLDTALALHILFAERDLELWDGKLEFIFESPSTENPDGQLLLADSVGPDELRLLYKGTQLSKEVLRLYYRNSDWYKSIATAQSIAAKSGQEDWPEICQQELKQSPQPLAPDMKKITDQLYAVIANQLFDYPVFPSHPSLENFTESLNNILCSYH